MTESQQISLINTWRAAHLATRETEKKEVREWFLLIPKVQAEPTATTTAPLIKFPSHRRVVQTGYTRGKITHRRETLYTIRVANRPVTLGETTRSRCPLFIHQFLGKAIKARPRWARFARLLGKTLRRGRVCIIARLDVVERAALHLLHPAI